MQIVDTIYELARTNKLIKGFRYAKPSEKGAGSDSYPLVWLDDPISGQTTSGPPNKLAVLRQTINVDFLGIPADDADVLAVQTAAYLTGLSFAEKLKDGLDSFTWLSLREYYDDNAAGIRFTFYLTGANPVNRCGDFFDPAKQFDVTPLLPKFLVNNPDGCAIFNDKGTLPNFTLE